MQVRLVDLESVIRSSWSRETSSVEEFWTPERPSTGQCGPTSLVVQDFLGGKIAYSLVNSLGRENEKCKKCPKIVKYYGTHIYNVFPYGKRLDLTSYQFPKDFVIAKEEIIKRDRVLKFRETERKYNILRERVDKILF